MSQLELRVPSVGESITEVQIGDWLVGEGASADKDQSVVVIETDKVTTELPAPAAGTVAKIIKRKGDKAMVGEVIGYLVAGAAAPKAAPAAAPAAPAPVAAAAPAAKPAPSHASTGGVVMPAAARLAAERGIDPSKLAGSGPGGRVLKEVVLAAGAPSAAATAKPAPSAPAPKPAAGARGEELVPMSPMRKRIAQRLVEAQGTAALLTTFNEIDMGAVMDLRNQHKDDFHKKHGAKLGFMSFFVKAACDALKFVPQVNAEIRGDMIVNRSYCDIGVAVGSGKGLVVPVLRNAETMSFAGIEAAIADFGARAQAGKITLDELSGGTFTISNGGIYGSLLSTPIVNPPQSGILGLHAIQDRPVARDGQVVIRPMMYVALTYDHRLVDGREAVTFLKRIKECIESPARMLMEI
jgi:2-oxoglutarate dehydrogenase E2 component (dihydrolipoamide succinyltransferase)